MFGVTFVGGQRLRRPAPIVFESPSPSGAVPVVIAPAKELVVDVAGAVKKPGVVHLPSGSRVEDAIKAVGGSSEKADLSQINQAAALNDGVQVYVRFKDDSLNKGEVASPYRGGEVAKKPSSRAEKKAPSGKVSLNSASSADLQSLPGVGPATAEKILTYRKEHGQFRSIDELLAVKGIGDKKLEKMRPFLKL